MNKPKIYVVEYEKNGETLKEYVAFYRNEHEMTWTYIHNSDKDAFEKEFKEKEKFTFQNKEYVRNLYLDYNTMENELKEEYFRGSNIISIKEVKNSKKLIIVGGIVVLGLLILKKKSGGKKK